ncbi:MAG TPA: glycosyltransferase family 87 protein [Gammaproteobacteria bacterium]|nr:glycosyltransferase family 87 protein [Gammaproteobacteria bacterium]
MSLKRISLFLLCFILLFVTLVVYFKRAITSGAYYGATDFYKFYESTLLYFSGQNLYSNLIIELKGPLYSEWVSANGNLNPPFFTLLLLPLHVFNYGDAYKIWSEISIACIFIGGYLALRPFPQWHKNTFPILTLFAMYVPNSVNLAYGQISTMLLVIVVLAWLSARENKDISAGLLIGFACAIKLFCGLFLIYFLCLKRYRLVAVSILVILMAALLGLLVFGIQPYFAYHGTLSQIGWYAVSANDSLYGFFYKLFSNAEKNQPFIVAPYLVNIFTVGCSVLLMGYLIRHWIKWGNQKFDIGFSLVIVSMLLLSPLGWVYYFPLLLIPYLVIVREGNTWTHLAACFVCFASMQTGDFLRPMQMKTMAQLFVLAGMGFYVLLAVLALLIIVYAGVKKSEKYTLSENHWLLIYAVVFIPAVLSLGGLIRGLYRLCH